MNTPRTLEESEDPGLSDEDREIWNDILGIPPTRSEAIHNQAEPPPEPVPPQV